MKKTKKKKVYNIISLMFLIVLLGVITYSFVKYTEKSVLNNERPGNITYTIAPSDTITFINTEPVDSKDVDDDVGNGNNVTVLINGKTNYDEDVEYLISFDEVNNKINGKSVPIAYKAEVYDLGSESSDYFTERNNNKTIYIINREGLISQDGIITIGYIKKGEISLNGTVNIVSFIDVNKMSSFGDEESEKDDTKVAFTPEEWDEIINKGVSFKVKVEMKKGIWYK